MTTCGNFVINNSTTVSVNPTIYAVGDPTIYNSIVINSVDTSTGILLVNCWLGSDSGKTFTLAPTFVDNDLAEYNSTGIEYLFCQIANITGLTLQI
jgi:hypothetical protein